MADYTTFIRKQFVTSKKILKTIERHGMLLIAVISKLYKEETPSRSYLFVNKDC